MRVVIDTSSLVALVRYYLPFDKDDSLKKFIKGKIDLGEIIILDKIVIESSYYAQGIVLKYLEFLKEKHLQQKTDILIPSPKFFTMLENQFCIQVKRAQLDSPEFENRKRSYLEDADAKLILYCQKIKDSGDLEFDKVILVTEETPSDNDGKLFKKIPVICDILGIEWCNLPTLLNNHFNLKLSEYLV